MRGSEQLLKVQLWLQWKFQGYMGHWENLSLSTMWLAWSSWRDARRGYQWWYSFCQSGEPRILEIHCRGMTAKENRCCTAVSQSYTLCDSDGGWLPRTTGAELRSPKATLCVIQMAESETCSCPDSLLSRRSWASDAGTELKRLIDISGCWFRFEFDSSCVLFFLLGRSIWLVFNFKVEKL